LVVINILLSRTRLRCAQGIQLAAQASTNYCCHRPFVPRLARARVPGHDALCPPHVL
jgi:hypothetical protein